MTQLTQSPAWKNLSALSHSLSDLSVASEFVKDPQRFDHYSVEAAGLFLDYSKQKINEKIREALFALAEQQKLKTAIDDLFSGALVNSTESLAALHTALRHSSNKAIYVQDQNIMLEVNAALEKMQVIAEDIASGRYRGFSGKKIQDVVNIGVGGSDLGPSMAYHALETYNHSDLRAHFISNLDSYQLNLVLKNLDPETTIFVVVSKSFTTKETSLNASLAWQWLLKSASDKNKVAHHFFAVTAKKNKAQEFGVLTEHILPLWDWVGGRFSLWSAVSLVLMMTLGVKNFRALLAGAEAMDQHFREAEFSYNMPVIMALLGIWNQNFLGARSQAIIPYDQRLNLLPNYLQQLLMESLGKCITQQAEKVDYTTGVVIWGGTGTNSQHAFHQLFMQGTQWVPIDFIISLSSSRQANEYHSHLIANCLSQARTLMQGKTSDDAINELIAKGYNQAQAEQLAPHLRVTGSCPSNIILMEALTPFSLGALIALYEHMTYVQSVIWNIDAFDQWGVEWGKKLANEILVSLEELNKAPHYDASTLGLLHRYQAYLNKEKL